MLSGEGPRRRLPGLRPRPHLHGRALLDFFGDLEAGREAVAFTFSFHRGGYRIDTSRPVTQEVGEGDRTLRHLHGVCVCLEVLPALAIADLNCVVETLRDENDAALDRRRLILEGAGKAFLRYGFERASMADIAVAAGVSRTALYYYFPGKDEVLQAVVDELNARSLQAAAEVLEKSQTLDAALTGLFEAKFGRTLVLFAESPHGVELVDAGHRVTGPATRAADKAFHALVVKALMRHGQAEDVDAVADTLIAAAKGLMRSGEVYVPKAKFKARIHRLIGWLMN